MTDPAPIDWSGRLDDLARRQAVLAAYQLPDPAPPSPAELVDATRRAQLLRRGRWSTVVPSRYVHAQLPDGEQQKGPLAVPPKLLDWCENPRGRNLVLLGDVGVGKTHLACAAALDRYMRGSEVVFAPAVELLDWLRPSTESSRHTMQDLIDTDLLVIDDLGAERATEWTAERLYAIVNRRWMEEDPIVATSNLVPEALEDALGPRMYSRLVGSGAVVVKLTGPDRRRTR